MKYLPYSKRKGVSIVELIVVVGLLLLVTRIATGVFGDMKRNQVLKTETERVVSIIETAHSNALTAKDASPYGVYIQSDRLVLFEGVTYATSSPNNKEILLLDGAVIASSTISGGSSIVFAKLSGETTNSGSIELRVSFRKKTAKSLIQVLPSGIINVTSS